MSNDLMGLVHAAIVGVLGVVVLMLRQQGKAKASAHVNGVGELYKRIEDAERRMQEKIEASRVEIVAAIHAHQRGQS